MNMCDLIVKKKRGHVLSEEEIRWMIREYTAGRIPDYQMSAMLMAICFVGMTAGRDKRADAGYGTQWRYAGSFRDPRD